MLGKLTRWLRMMGHDSKYSTVLNDMKLLEVAKKENRVLLTRDFALFRQATAKGIEVHYVEGNTESERLAAIAGRFQIPLEIDLTTSRCPKCNTNLTSTPKDEIIDKVQKNTCLHYDKFWRCPNCGTVYWQGAHWIKIRATLREAKEKLR
jgi:uncharacterized protein with PIN domain